MPEPATSAAKAARERFLSGELSPELEGHCLNVGRVAVEFACLEEDIGRLMVALEGGSPSSTAYMKRVRFSNEIPKDLRKLAKNVDAGRGRVLRDAASDYERFKVERDRYAHSSVGTDVTEDPETGMLQFDLMKQKHARGDEHVKGPVSDLPTVEETDDLVREMRATRSRLQDLRIRALLLRAVEKQNTAFNDSMDRMIKKLDEPLRTVIPEKIRHLLRLSSSE